MTKTTKNLKVPFGKFKGQPLEVLAEDAGYRHWITAQGWFRDRYPEHYTVIVNNFAEPDETPEHNALQAAFLNPSLCLALARLLLKQCGVYEQRNDVRLRGPNFECSGWDVVFGIRFKVAHGLRAPSEFFYAKELVGPDFLWGGFDFRVELKPTLGDDYPAVLRAIKARWNNAPADTFPAIVYEQFTALGAPIDAVTKIFNTEGIQIVRFGDIGVGALLSEVSP